LCQALGARGKLASRRALLVGADAREYRTVAIEMRATTLALISLAATEAEVLTLDSSSAEVELSRGRTFAKFYAPWCGHCKKLTPVWEELSERTDLGARIARIDCTSNRAVCTKYGVQAFPTLLFFDDRKIYRYSGARSLEALASWAQNGWKAAAECTPHGQITTHACTRLPRPASPCAARPRSHTTSRPAARAHHGPTPPLALPRITVPHHLSPCRASLMQMIQPASRRQGREQLARRTARRGRGGRSWPLWASLL
jgi:protein disulfide-isomerase-like protein